VDIPVKMRGQIRPVQILAFVVDITEKVGIETGLERVFGGDEVAVAGIEEDDDRVCVKVVATPPIVATVV
jgi:hypothetical protein